MRRTWLIAGCVLVMGASGCQPIEDYQLGKRAPLQEHELSPAEAATRDAEPIKNLPYGTVAYPVAAALLGAWYTERRGARIRQGLPPSAKPATGYLGERLPAVESVVQTISNFSTGLFTLLGKQGDGTQRCWKVLVSFGLAALATVPTIPGMQAWILSHANYALMLAGAAGFFGAVNAELNKVKPVSAPTPPFSP